MPHSLDLRAKGKRPRVRVAVLWATTLSIALHVALVPLLPRLHAAPESEASAAPIEFFVHPTSAPTQAPTPRPTPVPTPTPHAVPSAPLPPAASREPIARRPLVPRVPRISGTPSNVSLQPRSGDVPQGGNDTGSVVGAGPSSGGAGTSATASPATPAPEPTPTPAPTPTPKPACAAPNVDARIVSKVDPDYPEIARQQGVAGTATVKVTLGANGSVVGVSIARSSGNGALDNEAQRAARLSTYAPEISNCEKVAGSYLFVAEFEAQ
jgi:protein TonB